MDLVKFLRKPFLQNTSGRLLVTFAVFTPSTFDLTFDLHRGPSHLKFQSSKYFKEEWTLLANLKAEPWLTQITNVIPQQ